MTYFYLFSRCLFPWAVYFFSLFLSSICFFPLFILQSLSHLSYLLIVPYVFFRTVPTGCHVADLTGYFQFNTLLQIQFVVSRRK